MFIPARFNPFSCDRKALIRSIENSSSLMNPALRAQIRCETFYDEFGLKTGFCSSAIHGNTKELKQAVHSSNCRKLE